MNTARLELRYNGGMSEPSLQWLVLRYAGRPAANKNEVRLLYKAAFDPGLDIKEEHDGINLLTASLRGWDNNKHQDGVDEVAIRLLYAGVDPRYKLDLLYAKRSDDDLRRSPLEAAFMVSEKAFGAMLEGNRFTAREINLLRDGDGTTPWLHTAAKNFKTTIVTKLLANGADPNLTDANGATALFHAPSADIVRQLLDDGADAGICDKEGLPCYAHWGRRLNRAVVGEMVRVLKHAQVLSKSDALEHVWQMLYRYPGRNNLKRLVTAGQKRGRLEDTRSTLLLGSLRRMVHGMASQKGSKTAANLCVSEECGVWTDTHIKLALLLAACWVRIAITAKSGYDSRNRSLSALAAWRKSGAISKVIDVPMPGEITGMRKTTLAILGHPKWAGAWEMVEDVACELTKLDGEVGVETGTYIKRAAAVMSFGKIGLDDVLRKIVPQAPGGWFDRGAFTETMNDFASTTVMDYYSGLTADRNGVLCGATVAGLVEAIEAMDRSVGNCGIIAQAMRSSIGAWKREDWDKMGNDGWIESVAAALGRIRTRALGPVHKWTKDNAQEWLDFLAPLESGVGAWQLGVRGLEGTDIPRKPRLRG